ncbi:MAG: hypothetical protein ACRCZG_06050 [Culicoidibacterales bacterium]
MRVVGTAAKAMAILVPLRPRFCGTLATLEAVSGRVCVVAEATLGRAETEAITDPAAVPSNRPLYLP